MDGQQNQHTDSRYRDHVQPLHAIVSDIDGNLPAFCQILHHLTAKALNCHWGRWENLWDNRQTSIAVGVDSSSLSLVGTGPFSLK